MSNLIIGFFLRRWFLFLNLATQGLCLVAKQVCLVATGFSLLQHKYNPVLIFKISLLCLFVVPRICFYSPRVLHIVFRILCLEFPFKFVDLSKKKKVCRTFKFLLILLMDFQRRLNCQNPFTQEICFCMTALCWQRREECFVALAFSFKIIWIILQYSHFKIVIVIFKYAYFTYTMDSAEIEI